MRSAESSVLRRALSISVASELALEVFDLVAQVGTFTPDVLEARGDLLEQAVDRVTLVAEQAAARLQVPDFDRRQGHRNVPFAAGRNPSSP